MVFRRCLGVYASITLCTGKMQCNHAFEEDALEVGVDDHSGRDRVPISYRIDIVAVAVAVAAVTDSEADCCGRRPRADIELYCQRHGHDMIRRPL